MTAPKEFLPWVSPLKFSSIAIVEFRFDTFRIGASSSGDSLQARPTKPTGTFTAKKDGRKRLGFLQKHHPLPTKDGSSQRQNGEISTWLSLNQSFIFL